MKRVLCLLWTACLIPFAWGQDFASKFMEQCSPEDGIQCQTVGPKMIEKVMETMAGVKEDEEEVSEYLLSKLKSARIITATKGGEDLFHKAEELLERNKNRFSLLGEDHSEKNNKIFVRWHDKTVRELVVLNFNPEVKTFTIVNLTGDMDDRFMQMLSSGNLKED